MSTLSHRVLSETVLTGDGALVWAKRVALVIAGIAALAIAAKIKVPLGPVPITLGTFAVLSIGAAYGPRLGLVTMMGYLVVGAMGFDVFTNSSAEAFGLSYMAGNTGGYLVGYVLATLALGYFARLGWDRSVIMMAVAMLIGNALIYVPGVAWLAHLNLETQGWAWVWHWGFAAFVVGDAVKLALAALLFPALWRLVGGARA